MIRDNRSVHQRRKVGGGYFGPSNDKGNQSRREAEQFYSKATRDFDAWFRSQPREKQDEMRRQGVLPYSEMKANEYVFPVNTTSETACITPLHDPNDKAGDETFYSREKVEEFTRRLLATLEYSHSDEVRLHFELVRLVLRDAHAMTNDALAQRFRMTRAGINFRVQRIRAILAGKDGKSTSDGAKPANRLKNRAKTLPNPAKESPKVGVNRRVAAHPGSFLRVSKKKPRGARR